MKIQMKGFKAYIRAAEKLYPHIIGVNGYH